MTEHRPGRRGGSPGKAASARNTGTSGSLPAELTTFVGRREQLAEIRRLIGCARLVTLTGLGGVGKTRLAVHAGQTLARSFKDGVWFIDLAPLREPALVAAAVSQSLNLWDQSAGWTVDSLADYLAERRALLVLDNCEHLLDACAPMCETLLRRAPELRIVATSRQPLTLIGEAVVRVPPLTLPHEGARARRSMVDQYEALQLFGDRAAMAVPGFAVDEANIAAVIDICRRLDGIPLAIELVTARLRSLGLEQVRAGLDNRYRLLTRGNRTAIPRQQTLRALVEWSYDLCSAEEAALWRRLSVFSGSFDLQAAESVCGSGDARTGSISETLAALVEKSILLLEPGPRPRYRLLDTIRDFGSDRLAADPDGGALPAEHRDYYLRLVQTADAEWLSDQQVGWMNRLREEHPNVRAAMQFCFEHAGQAEVGLEMAGRLWAFWIAAGALGEGRQWLERGLRCDDARAGAARVRALWVVSYVTACQGDLEAASRWLDEGRSVAEAAGDAAAPAYLDLAAGLIAVFRGDTDEANRLLARALDQCRELGELTGVMDAQFLLGSLASVHGEIGTALELVQGTLGVCEQFGESWWRAWAQRNLAVILWRAGDRHGSTDAVMSALRSCKELNEQLCGALCLEVCSWCAAAEGEYQRAAILFGAVRGVWEALATTPFWQLSEEDASWETATRRALGDEAFNSAYAQGLQLTVEDAFNFALRDLSKVQDVDPDDWHGSAIVLTPREREVARCVADGLNNKEISAQLVISRRTAETHVEHILTKLGFTSRTQIAAWVAENQIAASARTG